MQSNKNRGKQHQKTIILPIISVDSIHCITYIHNKNITKDQYLEIVKYLEDKGFTHTYFEHSPTPSYSKFDYLELVKHDL